MEKTEFFPDLFRQMYWADAKIWKRLLKLPDIEKENELHKLLYHIHVVQYAFLKMWKNQPMNFPELDSFKNLNEISMWGYEYHQYAKEYLESFDFADLGREILVPWSGRMEKLMSKKLTNASLGETMLQVFSHSTYHRGQVNKKIRELGGEPPLVDYIAWVWYGKPAAVWPTF